MTPAAARPSTARAGAWRPHGRSWRASSCHAAPQSPPARPGAPQRRSARAPRPRTASRSSPPARPRAPGRRSGPRTGARSRGAPARRAPRPSSPVSLSSQSAVICALCWSSPITIVIWGLLKLHGLKYLRGSSALELRRSLLMPSFGRAFATASKFADVARFVRAQLEPPCLSSPASRPTGRAAGPPRRQSAGGLSVAPRSSRLVRA